MIILFDSTFELSNGVDMSARLLGEESWDWQQQTPEEVYVRMAYATFFPSRAVREVTATLFITFPQAANDEAAFTLAHELAASLPTGGTLEVTLGEQTVTFSQAVPVSWKPERIGVHVGLRLTLRCVNPDIDAETARAQFESGEFQTFE